MSFDYMCKYIIIGDTSVGKSCVLLQFIDHKFREKHDATIGVQFGSKIIKIQDKTIKLQIWDTAGQETFQSITRGYYSSAAGAVLVYDITNRQSFINVLSWLQEAKLHGNPQMVFILIGNKCDLQTNRKVTYQEGYNFAKKNNLTFLEVSAKTSYQITEVFQKITENLLEKMNDGTINLSNNTPGIKKGNSDTQAKNLSIQDAVKQKKNSSCCN